MRKKLGFIIDLIITDTKVLFIFLIDVVSNMNCYKFLRLVVSVTLNLILSFYKNRKKYFLTILIIMRSIRKKEYFYITERGHYTDIEMRRNNATSLFKLFICFFLLIVILAGLCSFCNNALFILNLLLALLLKLCEFFIVFSIILLFRNYCIKLQFYLLPVFICLINLDNFYNFSSFRNIFYLFSIVTVVYLIFVVFIPYPYLRQFNSSSWLSGVLIISILLPFVMDYLLVDIMKDQVELISKELSREPLKDLLLERYSVLSRYPEIIEVIELVIKNTEILEFMKIEAIFSALNFLLISAYAIGFLLVDIKLRLGDEKAKRLFEKLSRNPSYDLMRQCVYYGGDNYSDKLFENEKYNGIIKYVEGDISLVIEPNRYVKWLMLRKIKFMEFLIKII